MIAYSIIVSSQNWTVGRPGNEVTLYTHTLNHRNDFCRDCRVRQEARERRRNKDKQFKQQKVHTDSREIDEICPLLGNLTPPAFITGSMKQWRRKWYSVGGGVPTN